MSTQRREPWLYLGLIAGVFAVSLAAVFIRLAGEAPPLTIATYRLAIGAALTGGFAAQTWLRSGQRPFPGLVWEDLPLIIVASLSLALHFWAWTLSLQHTSVASSVVLVTASPLMVAVTSRLLLGEPIYKRALVGIGIGLVGGAVLALGDLGEGSEPFGDLMAFLGAVAIVGYLIAGRRLRSHMPAATYNTAVYAATAVLLAAAALVTGAPFNGFRTDTYLWLVVTALVPQAIGHSLLNWSLGHVTATTIAIAVMAEPVIATIAAVPILGEWPPFTSVLGGALILTGIYVAMRRTGSPAKAQ
ncbi:MAG: DMT family transporter [Chloroflexi bacterium]|nr:DMT family transporter [Chloroflexota bacterium]